MSDGTPIEKILSLFSGAKPSGDSGKEWMVCCPAHEDNNQSLKVTEGRDGRVLLKCYAQCDTKDILRKLDFEYRDLFPGREEKPTPAGVSVESLAMDKRLPAKFLREECFLTDELGTGKKGARQVLIPYRDEAGDVLYTRYRSALKASEGSSYKRGTQPRAYGLWRLPAYRAAGVLIIVEGESDSWSLWLHGYPALGIPGADAVNAIRAEEIAGFNTIYIWRDADAAGAKFVIRMAAKIAELRSGSTVKALSSPEAKDPNKILQLFGTDKFREKFDACLANATDPPDSSTSGTDGSNPDDPDKADFPFTDMGNAQRLVARHGRDIRYSDILNKWYVWMGHNWKGGSIGPIHHRAKLTVRSIIKELDGVTDVDRRNRVLAHAMKSESCKAIQYMVKLAESDPNIVILPSDLDADRFILNVKNGTIDLRTGELHPHRREYLITRLAPVEYDPEAKCPTWKVFMARVFAVNPEDVDDRGNAEVIQFMKRMLGYCLTGDVSEQMLPILYGGGSNGKTTLLNVVREIMGSSYSAKAPRGLLMAKRNEDSSERELTVLFGSRFVVASETRRGQRLSEELVKDLTGTETIRARYLYSESFQFDPTHKLVLCTNHRPRIPESDDAIWRRVMPVQFKTKFWNPARSEMGPDHLRRDNGLAEKLRAEYPGILAWIVRGCMEWQAGGLNAPEEVQRETAAYREEEDKTAQFLAEKCQLSNSGGNTILKRVYAEYCSWCESQGHKPYSRNEFSADLRSHNVVVKSGTGNLTTCFGLTFISGEQINSLSDLDD